MLSRDTLYCTSQSLYNIKRQLRVANQKNAKEECPARARDIVVV